MSCKLRAKKPIECKTTAEKFEGFSFCQFLNQSSILQDDKRIKIEQGTFQGGVVKASFVTGIQIAFSHFDRIPSSIFINFGDIKRLKIFKSKIDKIDRDDFALATNLEFLEIVDSDIESISSGAFTLLENLQEVKLNGNKIANYETPYDNRLQKLKTVQVNGQNFGFYNEEVGKRRV
ncbi:hypothetical protein PVAND_007930 [Polypedilum vanderplanki]|uniref:Uncharacterized protein n=1 Tax=Polypedilum vanderplanki TaxID=319348 RepID=A0A9J6C9C1_POLVA|nr:hypothetical protein PVAND_007930 [Polypedilum vanderplanki]